MRADMQQTLLFTAEQIEPWGRSIASICCGFPAMVVGDLATITDLHNQPEPDLEQVRQVIERLGKAAIFHVVIGDQVAQKMGQNEPVRIDGGSLQ